MQTRIDRRKLLASAAAVAGASILPLPAIAERAPLKIGFMTIKTGPLAQGGLQMAQGVEVFFNQRNYMLAGRKVELYTADTGGNPATAKTKVQELIYRDGVDLILGVLASFELIAIGDDIEKAKVPLLAHAGTDDQTQRHPNPYLVRQTPTSSQCMFPLADYAAKAMNLKKVVTISEDFAFGYEQMGGFQRVFEDEGGSVEKKLWPPLVTPDYTPYIAQIDRPDAVVAGFAGSNPLRFLKQYADEGKPAPVLGGQAMGDDALLKTFGDEAVGMVNSCPYTIDYKSPINEKFIADIVKLSGNIPGFYAADMYTHGMVAEAGLKALNGDTSNKAALIAALRKVELADSPRGPVKFDRYGQGIGNIFIRKIEKQGAKLVNTTLKTYKDVSQFWTYDPRQYLTTPAYSRDYPPLKS
jgi:branched-chain amino acid transport system substrate-binding protein